MLAVVYFFDESGFVAAVLPAAAVHELGHYLLLRLGHMPVRSLRLGLTGLEMDYAGQLFGLHGFLTVLAGPFFGIVYALAMACLPGDYCALSAGLSLGLSLVNLLPVLPLDGGRMLVFLAGERAAALSRLFSFALLAAAVLLLLRLHTLPPLILSLWLLRENFSKGLNTAA